MCGGAAGCLRAIDSSAAAACEREAAAAAAAICGSPFIGSLTDVSLCSREMHKSPETDRPADRPTGWTDEASMVDDVTILNYSAASRTFVFRLSPSVVVRCTQSGLGPVPAAVAAAVLFRRLTGSLPACRQALVHLLARHKGTSSSRPLANSRQVKLDNERAPRRY